MATCDHPSDLICRLSIQQLGSDPRSAALPGKKKRDLPGSFPVQGNDVDNLFYFIEPRPRNPWAAIGSLAFLSALVLAVIVIPLLHTDPLPKRETLTMLYLMPPPTAGGGSPRKLEAPKPTSSYTPSSTAILSPVHKTEKAPPPVGSIDGVPEGVLGGVVGGIPGGLFTQSPTSSGSRSVPVLAKPPDPTPVKRMRIASRVAEANLIHDVPPQYPPEAGRGRIEGTVVLMAVIGKDGTVKDVQIESGLPILVQAAIDAVKQWRYKPYLIDGEPVEVDSRITINFTLAAS